MRLPISTNQAVAPFFYKIHTNQVYWRANAAYVGDAHIRSYGMRGFGFCSREGTEHGKGDADREHEGNGKILYR